ncbi:hypothetical protein GCM10009794_00150 [Rothia terrae]
MRVETEVLGLVDGLSARLLSMGYFYVFSLLQTRDSLTNSGGSGIPGVDMAQDAVELRTAQESNINARAGAP